jgi:uncharacterized membrane-anchored protein
MRRALAVAWLLVVLIAVNLSIAAKERLLAGGSIVYLELAPIDPRSLMQGDYVRLNYAVANAARQALLASRKMGRDGLASGDGRVVVSVDARGVGTFVRLDDGRALAPGERLLRYRVRAGQLKFATDAFYFEEGQGARYEKARYGEFRVADDGALLLTALRGEALAPLVPGAD